MVKQVTTGKPYVYTFVYRVLIAGEEYLPYLSIKMGPKEELLKGQAVGDDYFITSVEIPPELIKWSGDIEVAMKIKCKSTSTYHMYDYSYNTLQIIDGDMFVWLDRNYHPSYTSFQRQWTTLSGLVMKNDVLNRFSYDLAKGQRLAIDYFITSVEIPPELIKWSGDIEVAMKIKCKSTSTYHMYDYSYNTLQIIDGDMFIWLDRNYYPSYTSFQREWTTLSGLVMKNDVLNRFSYDLAKGQRLAIGDFLSMALIDNPFLASMLRWGTSKGKFVAVHPGKLSAKFINHGNHYHEILEDSRKKTTEGAFAALKQMAQELQDKPSKSKNKSGILGRLRNSFSRLMRRH